MKKNKKKCEENWAIFRNTYLSQFPSNLVCRVMYIDDVKYINLIEIGPVVIEIQGVRNGKLAVPVNNTLVCHAAFLAADTRLCVLIITVNMQIINFKMTRKE